MSEKLKVPDEWCCVNHIDIAEINPKFDINQFKEDVEVSFLPMASVKEISGNYDLSKSRKLSAVKKGYTNFKNGDIIFAKITPCMENGKIAVLDNLLNGVGFGSTEFHVSRPYHDINAQFLFYYFVQSAFRKKAQRIMTGSAGQLRVSTEYFKKVNIPIPPLPEQRAIVSKIEHLFSDLDNGIENFKKAQEQLKRYRQSVLKNACEGRLVPTEAELAHAERRDYEPAGVLLARILKERREKWNGKGKYKEPVALDVGELPELSEGWEYARLRDISHAIGGYAFKSSDFKENGTYQVIKIGNVKMGHFRLDKKPSFIDNIDSQIFNKYRLNYGDLVITLTGTRKKRDYGFVAMVKNEKQMLLNQRLAVVRFFKPLIPEYFQYALRTEHFQNNFFKYETGNVGQGNVSMNAIISETIAIPPLAEQHRIFAEVESCLSLCDNMEENIAESLQKAESLRQSILKKAFEGKLLSENELEEARNAPDWEPAEKLLERIKAERINAKRKNKGKK